MILEDVLLRTKPLYKAELEPACSAFQVRCYPHHTIGAASSQHPKYPRCSGLTALTCDMGLLRTM